MTDFDYGEKLPDGQHERHPTLPPVDDKKFVRPLRSSYRHVGVRPLGATRPLTVEETIRYADQDYVAFEPYTPPHPSGAVGRYWTAAQLHSGCGKVTSMGDSIAMTYAQRPDFYSSTFCSGCGTYFPVGIRGEFVWVEQDGSDGPRVGT